MRTCVSSGQGRRATSATASSLQGEPSIARRIFIRTSLRRPALRPSGRDKLASALKVKAPFVPARGRGFSGVFRRFRGGAGISRGWFFGALRTIPQRPRRARPTPRGRLSVTRRGGLDLLAVQNLCERLKELLGGVGLREEHPDADAGGLGGLVVSAEAGGGDDLHPRVHLLERADGGRAVHEGHHHVGDDGGDLVAVLRVEADGLRAVAGGDDAVAEGFERALRDLKYRVLVVHDEDQLAAPHGQVCARAPLLLADRRLDGREIDRELRAAVRLAVDVDEAAGAADEGRGRRGSRTARPPATLRREERLEDAADHLGGDADACVNDRYLD